MLSKIPAGVLLLVGIGCLVYANVLGFEVAIPARSTVSGPSPVALTPSGWIQLIVSLLGGVGLTGAGIINTIRTIIAKSLPSNLPQPVAENVMDFAQITAIMAITASMPDGPTKDGLTLAGRSCFDEMRDNVFPVPSK